MIERTIDKKEKDSSKNILVKKKPKERK